MLRTVLFFNRFLHSLRSVEMTVGGSYPSLRVVQDDKVIGA
jgi:hypothetical protein